LNLPADFIQTIHSAFGEKGEIFLKNLPDLVIDASARWGLTEIQPVLNLSFNFVAFAKHNHEDVILKIGVLNPELTSEMAALKLFNGEGACQLIEHDEGSGLLLLERLKPGKMLSELKDDDERTHIAADLMQKIWRDINLESDGPPSMQEHTLSGTRAPAFQKFIKLSDWFDGLRKIRPRFGGDTGPFPKKILERVEDFLAELFAEKDIKLIHGDFHHFNILSSERGWLVIDPKGVIGPAGYEVGPFMINPWDSLSDERPFKVQAERRVSILSERLGWEREKIIKWSTAHAVLSAWWCIEDAQSEDNAGWEYSMWCAQMLSGLK